IGESPQPTNEQFENDLGDAWMGLDHTKPIWLEDESPSIGSVFVPQKLYQQMSLATVARLEMSKPLRVKRLIKDYASYPKELLIASIKKIEKRLGGLQAKTSIQAIEQDDFGTAIDIVLDYYDKAYTYDLGKRKPEQFLHLETATDDAAENAKLVLEFIHANEIKQ
ncbi:MAG: hypothetical protein K0B09_14760, partial [Bacteroidales bacterium]|nr:hypothetical protein [Bacteroidales bacterium]